MPATMRHTRTSRSGPVFGADASTFAWRGATGGSCTQAQLIAALSAHSSASKPYSAAKPKCSATKGSTSAPMPPPIGTAVWRMLMARPRSPASNQVITARPLAPFTLPPSRPTSSSPAPSTPRPGTWPAPGAAHSAIATSAIAVLPSPASSTGRPPQRSVSRPQGSSLTAMPRPMRPSTKPSAALSSS
ncbi:hypothetical protein D9M69_507960 [compost metagenome]